jgi:superfamily II DNA or RNA helicase
VTTLRPYQQVLEDDIERSWAQGHRVVLAIAPTGAGKTITFSNILMREPGASAAIAHRRELVSQMSLALARNEVRHRVIGPDSLRRAIVNIHMNELGRSYYDPSARCGVIGIDSLPGLNPCDPWLGQVRTFVGDEGHHFLHDNKWGRGVAMFPNARGLLVTATGFRADGRGLGRGVLLPNGKWSNDGLADDMVLGPPMRELIDMGYLTDYRVIAPPTDVDYSQVPVTASGDLSPVKLRAAVHKSSRIVGDVVQHYLKFAAGKLGVTFAVDVQAAGELAAGYRAAGIPSEVVSADTPDVLRTNILRRFRQREILQLVNVDLFGESFDLPALEVVSMVRKTESKSLFDQQFGRGLRVMVDDTVAQHWDRYSDAERRGFISASTKPKAIIIDHVGNVARHLPPDAPRFHTLDRRERRSRVAPRDVIPVRTCLNPECLSVYERTRPACPFCGHRPVPGARGTPEQVDGDLIELDAAALAALRGEVERVDGAVRIPQNLEGPAVQAIKNRHVERQHAQRVLRETLALWAGWQRDQGRDDSETYKRFYFGFGIDVLSAQALGRGDAEALTARIREKLDAAGVVRAIDGPVGTV